MTRNVLDDDWGLAACTLPTAERPTRQNDFDEMFSRDVLGVQRESGQRVRLDLRPDPAAVARAAGLAVQETECCSFFTFDLTIRKGRASLAIEAPAAYAGVVDALAARAEARVGDAS
jgi:hypothetical protein